MSVYYFLIFVLVVCSRLLLLSGRTTGYVAGQSTAVVEILQSSAPGLVMVMMMVGNAADAVGAGDGRCCYWYRSASSLFVTSAPGQSASYSFAQSSTDWFCSLSCPPVGSLIFFGCLWGGITSPNMHLVLLLYLIFRLLQVL